MQKKIISIIIALSVVVSCTAPSFAVSSTVVTPESSSATRWYINNNGLVTSATTTITSWGNMVTQITDSLAQSLYRVLVANNNVYSALQSYLNSNNTTSFYTWSWSESDGVNQGAPNGSQSAIVALRNYGSALTKLFSQNVEQNYRIRQLLENGGLVDLVGIKDNPDNGFNQSYLWKKYDSPSGSVGLPNFQMDGSTQSTSWSWRNHSALESIEYLMYFSLTNDSRLARQLVQGWTTDGAYLTNSDLTTSNMKTSGTSIFSDMRLIGTNLSSHLARLAFVLASDEEIEARQAAADNQATVVDDFIKPTGSGSASASDFADVASIGGTMKDALSSNVGAENAFTSLDSNSEAWNWFSQSIADSLDSSSGSARKSLKTNNYPTPMLDSYYSQLMETLKVK